MLGGLRAGTSTLVAEVNGGNIGYSNAETGVGISPNTFGSLNVSPPEIAAEGNYIIDLFTNSSMNLVVRGQLLRSGYTTINIGDDAYVLQSAVRSDYLGGAYGYRWNTLIAPLVDGQSYKLSMS